jgi:hypothetical protein
MKRLLGLVLVMFLMMVGISSAQYTVNHPCTTSDGVTTSIPVATTDTVYTHSFTLDNADYFAVSYYTISTVGATDITIQLEESISLPDTEGASDVHFTIPVSMPDIVTNLSTENTWYQKSLSPIALKYGRFKITGAGLNASDTTVQVILSKKSE